MAHRGKAKLLPAPEENSRVSAEVSRLRDDVIVPRVRGGDAGASKEGILTLLSEAAERGERRVPPRLLAKSLSERFAFVPRAGANGETVVRKALYDIARQSRDWYEDHPGHSPLVLVSSSGKIEVIDGALPQRVDTAETALIQRDVFRRLPNILRTLSGSPEWRFQDVPQDVAVAEFNQLFPEHAGRLQDEDIVTIQSSLYAAACFCIEMAARAVRPDATIIAVEHHPSHRFEAWDEPLLWLDSVYRSHRLRGGKVVRLVVIDPSECAVITEDETRWTNWKSHIRRRLFMDEVRVLIRPTDAWLGVINRDLLILPNVMVMQFCGGDAFPFAMRPITGQDASRITTVAQEIAESSEFDRISLMPKDTADDLRQIDDVKTRLREALREQGASLLAASK